LVVSVNICVSDEGFIKPASAFDQRRSQSLFPLGKILILNLAKQNQQHSLTESSNFAIRFTGIEQTAKFLPCDVFQQHTVIAALPVLDCPALHRVQPVRTRPQPHHVALLWQREVVALHKHVARR
jgi:hypothetical protein